MASSILAIQDCLTIANFCAIRFNGNSRYFQTTIVSAEPDDVVSYTGTRLSPVTPLQDMGEVDLVLIPSGPPPVLDQTAVTAWLTRCSTLRDWLLQAHANGAQLTSVCTGSIALAATGLLDGIPATTHWAMEQAAANLFPDVHWRVEESIIAHERVITSGGFGMIANLMSHLIREYLGADAATETARMMMMNPTDLQNASYRQGSLDIAYEDPRMENLKQYLAKNFRSPVSLEDMASALSTTGRTLTRICQKELGMSPVQFLQRIRLEAVMHALQLTPAPLNQIVWDVGYEDVSTFQRLFKRHTGLTMSEYRRRFAVRIHASMGHAEAAFEA